MKEFVNGTNKQYTLLKDSLEDHMCHVYKGCELPSCCDKAIARIGFEKEGETYALFIDKGITLNNDNVPSLFKEWISIGTIRFLDFNDMKEFLKNLKCLY